MNGEQLRDLGIARAESAAKEFRDEAARVIYDLACVRMHFTSDDLWPLLPPVRERRAIGGVMQSAVKAQVIKPTGGYLQSKRKEAHAGPKAVYRSMIFGRPQRWHAFS